MSININNNSAYSYVKAIFAIAAEKNNFLAWEQLLKLWATTIQLSSQLFSTNYIVDKQKQLALLLSICTAVHIDTFEAATNLLRILIVKKQLLLLPKIAELYLMLYAKHQKTLILKVVCVAELSEEQKQKLKTSLEMRLKSQLQLSYEIDANLIGGMKIYFDDQIIDLSVSGQLQRLKNQFKI